MARELIDSWNDYLSAADRLLAMATRSLAIHDEDLSALRLDAPERLARLAGVLAGHSDHPLRIALREARHYQVSSPRLQQLLNTWAHRAEIRQTPLALGRLRDNFLIVDGSHALVRPEKNLPRSILLIDESSAVAPYLLRFEEIWNESRKNLLQTPLGL